MPTPWRPLAGLKREAPTWPIWKVEPSLGSRKVLHRYLTNEEKPNQMPHQTNS